MRNQSFQRLPRALFFFRAFMPAKLITFDNPTIRETLEPGENFDDRSLGLCTCFRGLVKKLLFVQTTNSVLRKFRCNDCDCTGDNSRAGRFIACNTREQSLNCFWAGLRQPGRTIGACFRWGARIAKKEHATAELGVSNGLMQFYLRDRTAPSKS